MRTVLGSGTELRFVQLCAVPAYDASPDPPQPVYYDRDGLRTYHNHEFMQDPAFVHAYARGVRAAGEDYRWEWRVHVGLWAASSAIRLDGDFVECGVNRGFLSSAIMALLDWDTRGRTFYLLDTFAGLDERYVYESERSVVLDRNAKELASGFYTRNLDEVRANFSEWKNVRIVPGSIPQTLADVRPEKVAFLHLDMNCAMPEICAIDYFWPKLVSGAFVLLDDYAYFGYRSQKVAMDRFAASHGVAVLSLPTGQGLIVRPPHDG